MKKFAALAVLAAVAAANAQTILEYQTAPSTTNATLPASFADGAIVADDFAAGTGITANNGATYNFRGWADGGTANTTAAQAIAEDEVFTFGFDVTGAGIDLTALDIRLDRSGTGPNQFDITASINNGLAIPVLSHSFGDSSSGVDFTNVALAIPTLNTGDSIVFTIAAFGADSGGASSQGTFDLETVDFNGADPRAVRLYGSVVPEPASLVLIGLAALAIRRR